MPRNRLFYGLLAWITVLWAIGLIVIVLIAKSTSQSNSRMRHDFKIINAAQSVRTITATLNVNYMPTLADGSAPPVPSRDLFESLDKKFDASLEILRQADYNDKQWDELVETFERVIGSFRQGYEDYFRRNPISVAERAALMNFISVQTHGLTDLADNMSARIEQEILASTHNNGFEKTTLFVVIAVLFGTTIAVLSYFFLTRHLVDSVLSSQRSIDEMRRGNIELTLDAPPADGEVAAVVSAIDDRATELKSHPDERASDVTHSILQAVPSPVFILEDESDIVQTNPAAERLSKELGVMGRLPEKIRKILDQCIQSKTSYTPEDPRDALLFRIRDVEVFYLPRIFHFDSGRNTRSGWAVVLYNVSRIRWLDDIKTNLLSTISHEIKTPLTGIRMVLHLLLEDRTQSLSDSQRTMIFSANADSERLLVTLNSLLELSRAESGAAHLKCVPTQLKHHVESAVRLYAEPASLRNILIEVEHPETEFPEILADGVSLDEVLNNLLSNAIRHSPDGGIVKLHLSKPDSDHVRLSIIDQGPGVPEESRSLIFERFYRTPGQKAEGVGLGLFISREIIRAHEGRIGISERNDQLTEFYFDVPIA